MSHHPAERRSQVLSSLQEWSSVSCFPLGEINQAYANYFFGISYLALLNQTDLPVFNVTFEPGCRNFWHIHHQGGQVLLVTAGRGWYQEEAAPRGNCILEILFISPQVQSTGMVQRETAGFRTLRWRSLRKGRVTNG